MDKIEEAIRSKAYMIWERSGRTGNPEDHWLEAEREIKARAETLDVTEDRSNATVDDAQPAQSVEAVEAVNESRNGMSRSNS